MAPDATKVFALHRLHIFCNLCPRNFLLDLQIADCDSEIQKTFLDPLQFDSSCIRQLSTILQKITTKIQIFNWAANLPNLYYSFSITIEEAPPPPLQIAATPI